MPTLFTALLAHGREAKPGKAKQKQLAGPLPSETSGLTAGLAMVEAVGRGRRKKASELCLSLVDRFRVRAKPNPQAHVIVVGGGFAGLSAAYELESLGYKVTVLEAQKEVGGRVQSRDDIVKGQMMEAGAELIGRNHLAWWSYKRKFRLHFRPLSDSGEPPVILEGTRLDHAAAKKLGREMHRVQRLINHAARPVNADEPWLTRRAKKLDHQSLVQGLNSIPMSRLCRLAFIEQLQTDNGVDARRQSWLGNLAMIKGGGLARFWTETETHRCKGGNQQLAFRFRNALHRIRPGKQVRAIRITEGGVIVECKGGTRIEGTDVVLAIPPTMLSAIRMSPALPQGWRVQFGDSVKYLLNVRKGSWKPTDPDLSSDGPVDLTWEGTDGQPGKRAGLVAFSGAQDAITCCNWTQRRKRYLRELASVYPNIPKSSEKGKFIDWPKNRWTRGSYSFPKPGEVTRVGPHLRAGFKGRVHFAGEHTCYAFTGYMEGALRSGLRVAEQIARRDGVI